jgi:2-polyprenyl-6-methoxyphenol hydroxylase-like FAD-dependent oxidoreductase
MGCFDVAIAGGGPAGSVAAILLARAGARVALADSGATRPRLEGLSLRVAALLQGLGLPLAGVGPVCVRAARWGRLSAAPNREHVVERAAFDAALRAAAADSGVALAMSGVARIERRTGGAVVRLTDGRGLAALLSVEARGRRAPAAPGRRRGPATVAIAGFTGAAQEDAAGVEALDCGWVWRASRADLGTWTQLALDAAAVAPGAAGLRAAWAAALGPHAPFPSEPLVRAAELRLAAPRFDPAAPRLGDASVAMDPLSGHGLFWALSAALSAPAVLRAVIDGRADLAARFHEARTVATFWRQARIGRDFHALAARDGPFWEARRRWPDAAPAHPPVPEPALRPQVALRDGRLEEAEALVTAREPEGAAFVHGVAVAPLLRRVGLGAALAADAFASACPEIEPARARALHAWLVDRGALRPPDAAAA